MRRLKILTWPVHGSYMNTLVHVDHDWYLPVRSDTSGGYGGRYPNWPDYVREVPSEQVRDLDLDLILFQTPQHYQQDQFEILSRAQRALPRIYLEHNTPRPHPTDSKHTVDDPDVLLVHVTHFNQLMWDNGRTPTHVIEHSVSIDPSARYTGRRERGITVINEIKRRGRIAGCDLFLRAREEVPLDVCGIASEQIGGLGDISYEHLHHHVSDYRFLFSPMRYTSLPLAVIEGLTIGMPIIALATTELPTVIENGVHGYVSCDLDELIERMHELLDDPAKARRLGNNARQLSEERFGLDRFCRDWEKAFRLVGADGKKSWPTDRREPLSLVSPTK